MGRTFERVELWSITPPIETFHTRWICLIKNSEPLADPLFTMCLPVGIRIVYEGNPFNLENRYNTPEDINYGK